MPTKDFSKAKEMKREEDDEEKEPAKKKREREREKDEKREESKNLDEQPMNDKRAWLPRLDRARFRSFS